MDELASRLPIATVASVPTLNKEVIDILELRLMRTQNWTLGGKSFNQAYQLIKRMSGFVLIKAKNKKKSLTVLNIHSTY